MLGWAQVDGYEAGRVLVRVAGMTLERICWLYRDVVGDGRYSLCTDKLHCISGIWQVFPAFAKQPESLRDIDASRFEACHGKEWHLRKGGGMRVKFDTHTGVFSHA